MEISVATDIFHEKMSNLIHDIEYAKTYLDDLVALTKGSFSSHIYINIYKKMKLYSKQVRTAGLKINTKSYIYKIST